MLNTVLFIVLHSRNYVMIAITNVCWTIPTSKVFDEFSGSNDVKQGGLRFSCHLHRWSAFMPETRVYILCSNPLYRCSSKNLKMMFNRCVPPSKLWNQFKGYVRIMQKNGSLCIQISSVNIHCCPYLSHHMITIVIHYLLKH